MKALCKVSIGAVIFVPVIVGPFLQFFFFKQKTIFFSIFDLFFQLLDIIVFHCCFASAAKLRLAFMCDFSDKLLFRYFFPDLKFFSGG